MVSQPPRYDGFAIDLDGVVWLSRDPIAGSVDAIRRLRGSGHPVVFVTNDPRSTRAELAERLSELGAPTAEDDVLTSATATARELARSHPGAAVMAVGTESLERELAGCGLRALPLDGQSDPTAVVIGGGGRLDFEVLRVASSAVREGAELWATNRDPTYPTARGLVPGTGAIVAAIEVASGVRARSVGKPEPALFEAARERLGGSRPLMAGDSLHSDVAGAARAGFDTALILTGRDGRDEIPAAPQAPDLVYDDLAALANRLA